MQTQFGRGRRWLLVGLLLVLMLALALVGIGHFTVHAAGSSISLSAPSGKQGQSISVQGQGFGASELITLALGTKALGQTSSASDGSFSATFTVPMVPSNVYTMSATGKKSHDVATASFTVIAYFTLAGSSTEPTSKVRVSGFGFGEVEQIALALCVPPPGTPPPGTQPQCKQPPSTLPLGTTKSAANGNFNLSFTVPYVSSGLYTISATGATSHDVATAIFIVAVYPLLSLSTSLSPPGSSTVNSLPGGTVKVSAQYFAPNELVTISLNNVVITQVKSGKKGNFKTSFVVPQNALGGTYTVLAVGQSSGLRAQTFLHVNGPLPVPTP